MAKTASDQQQWSPARRRPGSTTLRVLGVDFGFARIGLAVGESSHHISSSRPNIAAGGKLDADVQAIVKLAQAEECEAIVVGIPYEEDGSEGRMARICLDLASRIAAQGWKVATVSEQGSTHAAEKNLRQQKELKASQRRKLRDGEAARLIVERFFDEEGL